jgi:hypothetical protein
MIERRMGLLGALLVLAQAGTFWGCSSSSDSTPATGGSTSTSTGGSTTTGTGGTTSSTGGTTSSTGGGSAACAMQTLPTVAAECKGIKTMAACTTSGTTCADGLCGIADTGRRDCSCNGTWTCELCNYDTSPFKCPPAGGLPACTTEADKAPCTTACSVCDKGSEICACYWDDEGALIWDCDGKPSTWGTAACP